MLDAEGRLWLAGRVEHRVKQGGKTWWPQAAELLAAQHPDITHAAYFGAPGPNGEDLAVLAIEPAPGLSPRDLHRLDCESCQAVAPYPVDISMEMPRIPRDPRHASKTDLLALRRMLDAMLPKDAGPPPRY
jgi:acyl-CoA synthetase (AMP-forming)/AMP-acid ligase II